MSDETPDLTGCDGCGQQTLMLWVVRDPETKTLRWLCTACYQAAKQLPTLRQLVQMRSQTR